MAGNIATATLWSHSNTTDVWYRTSFALI